MISDSKEKSILVKLNGEVKSIPQNISILSLLEDLKISPSVVVIELNKKILKKEEFSTKVLNLSDEIEIITFVGGG